MDDGSLTDSFGRKVDFRNTVVIMTSNIGTKRIKEGKTVGFGADHEDSSFDSMQKKIKEELRKLFNPELLNRLDDTLIFRSLDINHIKQIVDILVADVAKRLAEKGISFNLTDEARSFLAENGFEPMLGARPLKRAIQKYLEDPLAEELLRGQFAGDCDLIIGASDDELTFSFNDKPAVENKSAEEVNK
jgi:ATP-dependent Clp protease ATP-binding subunit ClpC